MTAPSASAGALALHAGTGNTSLARLGRSAQRRGTLGLALALLGGCSETVVPVAMPLHVQPRSARSAEPALAPASRPHWGIPHFFEVGARVALAPGERPVDTSHWISTIRAEDSADPRAHLRAVAEDQQRIFVYDEPDPVGGAVRRLALVLPLTRPYDANDRVAAYWDQHADVFNFGVDRSRIGGALFRVRPSGALQIVPLKSRFQPSGTNVQAYEAVYRLEDSELELFEHKGLVPGLPVAFDRFVLYDRRIVSDRDPPQPLAPNDSGIGVQVALLPSADPYFTELSSFEVDQDRVLYVTDARGDHYFLAAPAQLDPTWHFGSLTADLLAEALPRDRPAHGEHAAAALLLLPSAAQATLFSGKVSDAREIGPQLSAARAFLAAHEAGLADLRERGEHAELFMRQYTHAFLAAHRSLRDPRAITELPYGDHFYPENAPHSSANVWYGSDQASVLLGLCEYVRKFPDPEVQDAIWGIAESSIEAMAPSHSVYMKRFDEMLLATELDRSTGRADVFIDNGGQSVSFNHTRLVLRRGYERIAGVTWGAFGLSIAHRPECVDDGRYRFSVDPESLPKSVRTDQDQLSVSRLFTRSDGALRIRENATVQRGIPAARIENVVENIGARPLPVDELRMTVGDFFHYGDGSNEIAQNRYGFSRVFEGVPLHVGFWMEGMPAPLWGDGFPAGWVDLSALYRRLKPRFMIVYGYDKAQIYATSQAPDAVLLYNAGKRQPGAAPAVAKDGYAGWTSLQLRYAVDRVLAPGASLNGPSVDSYTLWAPLFSADADEIPDALQELAPLWTELIETTRGAETGAALEARLSALADRERAARVRKLLHMSLETDYAYAGMQSAWMQAADLFGDLARAAQDAQARQRWQERSQSTRAAALRGAEFSLTALQQLRARADLMPAFGIMRYYGFHVAVFDWAYRETCDARFRDAMLSMADQIARDEREGGLQVKDPDRPNYGGFVINEFSHTSGSNNLDDQGIKLWALRIAYERTRDARYRNAAVLCIEHWIRIRAADDQFWGISKLFDRYLPTGPNQQRTPYGHYTLLAGLRAWADLEPRARELYRLGLAHATSRHVVGSIGTTGAYHMVFPDEGIVHFGTNAELGGTFLWALTLDAGRLAGRWAECRHAAPNPSRRP